MIIVQIIHSLNPGGAERLVVDLANEFSKKSADKIYIISLKNRDEKNENFYFKEISTRIEFIPMNYGDGFKFAYLTRLYQILKKISPDIVHIHCQIHYLFYAFLFYHKCKYVYTLHNKANALLPGIRKFVTRGLSELKLLSVASISAENRKSLREFTGIKSDVLIYNGRAKPEISGLYTETSNYIQDIKRHPDDIILLSIAKCSPQKNLQLLINAVNHLVDQGVHIQLLIIGDKYFDTPLGRSLVDMAGKAVHFLGPRNNVCDYFSLSDAFCLSSSFEGMPITLIEAYACGCIPLSTPVSGSIDIIEDGVTGFISADFLLESYINTIQRFIKQRSSVSKHMLIDLYNENYSIEKCAGEYYSLYEQLITE